METTLNFFRTILKAIWNFLTRKNSRGKVASVTDPLNITRDNTINECETAGRKDMSSIENEKVGFRETATRFLTEVNLEIEQKVSGWKIDLENLETKINEGLDALISKFKKIELEELAPKFGKLQVKAEAADEENHNLELEKSELKPKVNDSAEKPGAWTNYFVKSLIILIDSTVLAEIFDFLGVNIYGLALLMGASVAVILVLFAQGIAKAYHNESGTFSVWTIFGLIFLLLVVAMRVVVKASYWYFTAPLIICLWILSILLSLRRLEVAEEYRDYDRSKTIDKKMARNEQTKTIATAEARRLQANATNRAELNAENEFNSYKKGADVLRAKIERGTGQITSNTKATNAYVDAAEAKMDMAFDKGQRTIYKGRDYKKDEVPFWRNVSMFFIMGLSLFLISCGNSPDESRIVGLMADNSTSVIPSYYVPAELLSKKTMHLLVGDISVNGTSRGELWSVVIDGQLMPKMDIVEIPAVPHLLLRDRDSVKRMHNSKEIEIRQTIRNIYQDTVQVNTSEIYMPTSYILNRMSKLSGERHLWIMSDMVEQSFTIMDFTEFKNNPSRLINEDYDRVKEKMLGLQPLEPLDGISVKFIYPDSGSFGTLAHYSRLFFKKLLQEHGAFVEITPGL